MVIEKRYNKEHPIILGLAGKAATGKTSVAESIVPKGTIAIASDRMVWDHVFFALPLYELANIKKNIEGINKNNRQLFSIHQTVFDIYGGNAMGNIPSYEDFTSLVNEIHSLPIEPEGVKPRTFLQTAGDMCRRYDENCFSKWAIDKAKKLFRTYTNTDLYEENESPMCVIISDVRFLNEAEIILNQPNGILICYEASEQTRNERLLKRDGRLMTEEQSSHKSEKQIDLIKEIADAIIHTDTLSIEDQANKTMEFITSRVGQYA